MSNSTRLFIRPYHEKIKIQESIKKSDSKRNIFLNSIQLSISSSIT